MWEVLMTIGTVKFFNTSKGFGFIAPEGGGKDVFVHATAVESAGLRTLTEGQKVSFDIVPDARGRQGLEPQVRLTPGLRHDQAGGAKRRRLFLWTIADCAGAAPLAGGIVTVTVFWPDPLVVKLALPVRAPIEAATLYWPAGSFISTRGVAVGLDHGLAALHHGNMFLGQILALGIGEDQLDRIAAPGRIVLGRAHAGGRRFRPRRWWWAGPGRRRRFG